MFRRECVLLRVIRAPIRVIRAAELLSAVPHDWAKKSHRYPGGLLQK
jgi:hypothetical protein